MAERREVDQGDRHERPVEAEDDKDHPEGGDHNAADNRADDRKAEDQLEEGGKQVREQGSDRADHQIACDDRDGDDDERREEHLEGGRHPLLDPVLDHRAEPDHQKDRDDRRGIARGRHDDRQAEEGGIPGEGAEDSEVDRTQDLALRERDHRRVDERKGDSKAIELVHLELLGGRVAKDDRQEVEHAVSHGIEQRIGTRGRKGRGEGRAAGKDALHDAGSGEGAEHRREDAGDQVDDH